MSNVGQRLTTQVTSRDMTPRSKMFKMKITGSRHVETNSQQVSTGGHIDFTQGGPKIWNTFLYALQLYRILTNFQSFSQCQKQEIICKDPTTPQVCRYITL